ncbi:MAG: hypothetical protein O7G85_12850 [Planctomycetota bacterium]|nr:hypothetical protein [Planctomycetota bacterium]
MKNSLGSMGQVVLGFRSLIIKLSLFVLFAALLAWALGGTLFPRPEIREPDSILFQGQQWYWRIATGGKEPGPGRVVWQLMMRPSEDDDPMPIGTRTWVEGVGPIVVDENLYYAGLPSRNPNEHWRIERIDDTLAVVEEFMIPDRLAVERQLARLKAGLPIQDPDTIEAQRELVLDPAPETADREME